MLYSKYLARSLQHLIKRVFGFKGVFFQSIKYVFFPNQGRRAASNAFLNLNILIYTTFILLFQGCGGGGAHNQQG